MFILKFALILDLFSAFSVFSVFIRGYFYIHNLTGAVLFISIFDLLAKVVSGTSSQCI